MTTQVCLVRYAVKPQIRWVDLDRAKKEVHLPHPWGELEERGFHADLVDRAYAHLAYARENGGEMNALAVLQAVGAGFLHPFDLDGGLRGDLRGKAIAAIRELSEFYGDRVSAVVWNSLAHLALREDPEHEQSIIKEASAGTLPYHYLIVDSALHATGLVYTFLMHVNSVMFAHTERIVVHNCDCSCSLLNMERIGGSIHYTPQREKVNAMTQSVFTHFLAETVKLMECFLPFAYSITPEAREIKTLL